MKISSTLILLLVSALSAFSQDKDILLSRINDIKMDSEHFVFGVSTIQGNQAEQVSRDESLKNLHFELKQYFGQIGFKYLKSIDAVPYDDIEYLSCQILKDCVRTIAFVRKERLAEIEACLTKEYESLARRIAVDSLIQGLKMVKTIDDVITLVDSNSLHGQIKMEQRFCEETQKYINGGFLIFFEPSSGMVLEVMTPLDNLCNRKNLSSGLPTNPLKYHKSIPFWLYLTGMSNDDIQ